MTAAARLLREPTGPNVAAVEFSGRDSHANHGLAGGQLDRLLGQLAEGILAFKGEMGARRADTTVVVMTEFGRTARPNGTNGTDHGTAGAGFVMGPNVARSAVVSDWPGLSDGRSTRDATCSRPSTPDPCSRASSRARSISRPARPRAYLPARKRPGGCTN